VDFSVEGTNLIVQGTQRGVKVHRFDVRGRESLYKKEDTRRCVKLSGEGSLNRRGKKRKKRGTKAEQASSHRGERG